MVDAPDEGRLARSRRPADHDNLAAPHLERDVVQDVQLAEPLFDIRGVDDDRSDNGTADRGLRAGCVAEYGSGHRNSSRRTGARSPNARSHRLRPWRRPIFASSRRSITPWI